jgi:excisionase family DNA binding protein
MPASNVPLEKPFLTAQEVSDLLRVSVYTVRRWIKEGTLPAYKVGRGWRIKDTDLDDWLDQQRLAELDENQIVT